MAMRNRNRSAARMKKSDDNRASPNVSSSSSGSSSIMVSRNKASLQSSADIDQSLPSTSGRVTRSMSARASRLQQRDMLLSSVYRPCSASSLLTQTSSTSVAGSRVEKYRPRPPPKKKPTKTISRQISMQQKHRYSPRVSVQYYLDNQPQKLTYMPFCLLPSNVKVQIFRQFSLEDKGKMRLVCKEWNELLCSSSVWDALDLSLFRLCSSDATHACGQACYANYKRRIRSYVSFMCGIRPAIQRVCFALDIGDRADRWMLLCEQMFQALQWEHVKHANINWKETPVKPFWVENNAWSVRSYRDIMVKHQLRQKKFSDFLRQFTSLAVNLETFIIPFKWTKECVDYLSRLKKLRTLVIEKFFVFQLIDQALLSKLVTELSGLETLVLQMWLPCGHACEFYDLSSPSITCLDIRRSRGLFIKSMTMPKLRTFKALRHVWNGPIACFIDLNLPCIYPVLVRGAPNLEQINDHMLKPEWKHSLYPELENLMKTICYCKTHKSRHSFMWDPR